MRDILGGKGAGLAEMANLGLPVPPGFTISAKLCLTYLEQGTFPHQLHEEVDRHLKQLEQATKKRFGDPANPLLVSVRSGAAVSMPGMMETILNLGLNDATVQGLITGSKNSRFAYDSYRRFVQMYGDVVFDLGKQAFGGARRVQTAPQGGARNRSPGRRPAGAGPGIQVDHPGEARRAIPRGPDGAAVGRDRGGVQELEHAPGGRLPQGPWHPGRP